jgi:hypothetical protein
MQSLAKEPDKLRLNVVLQGVWEGRPEGAFLDGHDVTATRKVATRSAIADSVNFVGGSCASLRAETGILIKFSAAKKTTTIGVLPGRFSRW